MFDRLLLAVCLLTGVRPSSSLPCAVCFKYWLNLGLIVQAPHNGSAVIRGGLTTWIQTSNVLNVCLEWQQLRVCCSSFFQCYPSGCHCQSRACFSTSNTVSLVGKKKKIKQRDMWNSHWINGLLWFFAQENTKIKKKIKPKKSGVSWVKCECWEVWHKH